MKSEKFKFTQKARIKLKNQGLRTQAINSKLKYLKVVPASAFQTGVKAYILDH